LKKNRFLFFLFLTYGLIGCTSLDSVSTSSVPASRGKPISASSDKFIFFAFNFSNTYVDQVVTDLARKCPNGRIQGILTKQESINYFLYMFWKSRVTASGYCVQNQVAGKNSQRTPSGDTGTDEALQ